MRKVTHPCAGSTALRVAKCLGTRRKNSAVPAISLTLSLNGLGAGSAARAEGQARRRKEQRRRRMKVADMARVLANRVQGEGLGPINPHVQPDCKPRAYQQLTYRASI